jgi:hypothetical protein
MISSMGKDHTEPFNSCAPFMQTLDSATMWDPAAIPPSLPDAKGPGWAPGMLATCTGLLNCR